MIAPGTPESLNSPSPFQISIPYRSRRSTDCTIEVEQEAGEIEDVEMSDRYD